MNGRRLAGLTVGVGMILGLACSLTASVPATRLRRYVSAPLPDGQRYTFLYPDRLRLDRPVDPDPEFQVRLIRRINGWQALTNRAALTDLLSRGDGEAEQICVYTRPDGGGRSGWWRMKQPDFRVGSYWFQASFMDAKKQRFTFSYRWSPSQNRWCAPVSTQIVTQIVDSFRVLAPGEAPPVDTAPRAVTTGKESGGAGNDLSRR